MTKSVMRNNSDLKLRAEQVIDDAYMYGYEDGKKESTLHCWTTKEIEACEEIKNEAYQRGNEDAWKHIVDVRSKDIKCGYNRGLNDAWKFMTKIVDDNFEMDELKTVFGTYNIYYILKRNTASEAMQKIKDYERKQKEHRNEIDEKILEENTKRTCDNCSHPKYGCQECGEDLDNWKQKPLYENCKKCKRFLEKGECHMEGCCGWYYYEPMNSKDDYVDAIVKVRVPKWQIGEKVNLYFKDTMSMDGICEADKK